MNIETLYRFSPETESKLDAKLRFLKKSQRSFHASMRTYRKNSLAWHISALWWQIIKDEKDGYETTASMMRTMLYLWERHDKKLQTRSDEQMEALAREKLEKAAEELLAKITGKGETKVRPIDPRIVS